MLQKLLIIVNDVKNCGCNDIDFRKCMNSVEKHCGIVLYNEKKEKKL